jgi:hypothetical protein
MRDQIESRQHGDETNVDLAKQFLASRRRKSDVEIRVFRRETEDFEIVELDYLVLVRDVWLRVEELVCTRHRGFVVAILLRGRRHVDGYATESDNEFNYLLCSRATRPAFYIPVSACIEYAASLHST